ncbi:MAG: hypothetical protein ACTSU2_00745 [Promethearchaeota archaeon]
MRTSIKIISAILTVAIFVFFDIIAYLIDWQKQSNSPLALFIIILIFAVLASVTIFLVMKKKKETGIKL